MNLLSIKCVCVFLLFFVESICHAQNAQKIVDNYLEAIGGKGRWEKLKSRKAIEERTFYSSNSVVEVVDKFSIYTKYYLAPGRYLVSWNVSFFSYIRTYTPECNWYYSSRTNDLSFFSEKLNSRKTDIPEIRILDILSFPMIDTVIEEDNLYRIDFNDVVWDRTLSVYFDKESHLVRKHTYRGPETILREFYYSDYKDNSGYVEPYEVKYYIDGALFSVEVVKTIEYNIAIKEQMFISPVECDQGNIKPIKLEKPIFLSD